jgi:hypothetical protein
MPYTGLKPSQFNERPVIKMAGQAVRTENMNDLMNFILSSIKEDVWSRFDDVLSKKDYEVNDVDGCSGLRGFSPELLQLPATVN